MSDEYKNDQAPAEAQDPVTAEQERYAHPEFYTRSAPSPISRSRNTTCQR